LSLPDRILFTAALVAVVFEGGIIATFTVMDLLGVWHP
jgi:hypothetical protein